MAVRVEGLIFAGVGSTDHDGVARFFADFHQVPLTEFFDELLERTGPDVVRHLFQVASSLDSMVLGEPQIVAQVKEAYSLAQVHSASGPLTNELFQPGPETNKEFYAEAPISLQMVGSYHQFGAFVSGVASLPRVVIMTMHDISLTPRAGKDNNLVLKGTVKTYRYLDDEETAAAEQAAAAAAPAPATGGAP